MANKISVIIPVYNGEKTIKFTIESVLNQTFSNLEIIVINDGSTDSTVEVVKNISDSRVQIFSYSNAGPSTSRNRGITQASGEYISFIDADDMWTNDKLESQLAALQNNKNASVAYSWTDFIDADDKFVKAGRRITSVGNVYSKLLVCNFLENGSNALISRYALETVGGFDESLWAAEDWDVWLRLSADYEFVVVPKVQILYRVSSSSLSTNLLKMEVDSLQVIERAFTYEKAKSLQHLKKESLAQFYKYMTFKAIDTRPAAQTSWESARFLWNWLKYDRSALKQRRIIFIAVLKIAFPKLYDRLKQLFNT
jgi:glycosyltransferase involved in cell wall biosynthesis